MPRRRTKTKLKRKYIIRKFCTAAAAAAAQMMNTK
jgi:hypothetical protein